MNTPFDCLADRLRIVLGLAAVVVMSCPAPAAAAPSPPPEEDVLPEGLQLPELLEDMQLIYPEGLARTPDPPAGVIEVRYVVDVDGRTKEAEVVQALHPDLDAAALVAVQGLRYTPARYEEEPVEFVETLVFEVQAPQLEAAEPTTPPSSEPPPPPPEPSALEPIRVRGRIREAGDRGGVGGAIITAIPAGDLGIGRVARRHRKGPEGDPPWRVQVNADEDGHFALRGVPDGRVRLIVLTPGYERYDHVFELEPQAAVDLELYQTRMNTNPYRTEVDVDAEMTPSVSRHAITAQEVAKAPGTSGDALKSVQNFPGVARPPFGTGRLAIRGAAPGDSSVVLGGHELPYLFHFLGVTSVFNADLVERIDYYPGNFDSRYGNALGGVVDVRPRRGRRDGFHGYVDADLFDAGALVEGPVGKGSAVASVRRSYIDAVLPAVIPDDAGIGLTVAPRYWDYQALFDHPLGGGEFSARAFGSDDELNLVLQNPNDPNPDDRGRLRNERWFHRADLEYRKRWGRTTFMVTPSYRRDFLRLNVLGDVRLSLLNDRFSTRSEVTQGLGRRSELRVGTEIVVDWLSLQWQQAPLPAYSSRGGSGPVGGTQTGVLTQDTREVVARPAVYSTLQWGIADTFRLFPGVRATFHAGPRNAATVEPRLRAVFDATDTTTVTAAVGIHSMGAALPETDRVFGNPRLRPEHSVHTSAGVTQTFGQGWSVSATGYHKHLWSLVSNSPDVGMAEDGTAVPERFDNAGIGRVFGGELMLRKDMTRALYGWVAYSVSRSEIQQRPREPWQLFDFDQPHALTLLAAYRLPRGWQVGARFRFTSGQPITTRVNSVSQLYDGGQLPLEGDYNAGGRLPPYHQLDLRVDKTWAFRLVRLDAYLDVQNVYNAKNAEFLEYAWNYQSTQQINSLPILPSLGLKLQW